MKSSHGTAALPDLQLLYDRAGRDLEFDDVLSASDSRSDAALAELIDADGRFRIARGSTVTLERYVHSVPNLLTRPDPLDAAIDVTLRSLSGRSRANPEAIEELIRRYPNLEPPIREAATLNAALWSTTGVRERIAAPPAKPLPCEFGPMTPNGQRRYVLQKLLGQGSFGQVYQARDLQLSEEGHTAMVAIKILMGGDRSPMTRQRVIDEATKVRRISHPNVVMVLDRGVTELDEDYIVYEYIDGGDLGDIASTRAAMPIRNAVKLVTQIAMGVHAAHAAGVIHCDLKPGNIMLTSTGEPKVGDFGIAVRLSDRSTASVNDAGISGGPIGNVAFISPEQYRGEDGALSVPSDIYALGGVLYLLLTGQLPNGSSIEQIAQRHDRSNSNLTLPDVRSHRPEVDLDLQAICQRALAVRPEHRYRSAAAMAEDLERWLHLEPLDWTRPSAVKRLKLWSKRKPALAAAVGLIIALTIAGTAVALRLNVIKNRKTLEAAINKLNLDREQRDKEVRLQFANLFTESLMSLKNYRFNTEALSMIWVLEYALGERVLGRPDVENDLWKARIINLRALVRGMHEQGRQEDMETLLWESALGYWLVCDKDHAEAEPLLRANLEKWRKKLAPTDAWLTHVEAMLACAAVNRLAAASQTSPVDPQDLQQVDTHLSAITKRAIPTIEGTPIHFMLKQSRIDLCGPTLLNLPDQVEQLNKELQSLLDATARNAGSKKKKTK